jgi:TRAP-type mannitol/chloroaromatic compound transport system permease large subunit
MLYRRYPERVKLALEFAAALLIILPFSLFVCWLAWGFVAHSYALKEVSPDPGGLPMRWIVKSFVIAGYVLLALAALGSIMAGIAAPTEAVALGALGCLVILAASGKLEPRAIRETCIDTLKKSAMIFFVIMTAQAFSLAIRGLGGQRLIQDVFALIPGGTTTDILFVLAVLFFAGILLEWVEIGYIVLPLFIPYVDHQPRRVSESIPCILRWIVRARSSRQVHSIGWYKTPGFCSCRTASRCRA